MGGIKKQRKKYQTPGHPWQSERIEDELRLLGRYGLRNKREVWRLGAKVRTARSNARDLLALREADRKKGGEELLSRLFRLGVLQKDAKLDDVLGLSITDFAERRLQTMVVKQGLGKSMAQARQLITHEHIAIEGQTVTSPSYHMKRGEGEKIAYAKSSPFANPKHKIHARDKKSLPEPKKVLKKKTESEPVVQPEGTQPELDQPAPGEKFVKE
ncbi:MAG: 30S ribosomal protein S4 [Candidatus Ranarchaeia archaeon]|jgi:small subunit ribosomal protein S4